MNLGDFAVLIFANDQFRAIVVLVLANLVLGVVGAVKTGTFTLIRISDYARTRLIPAIVVYAVGVGVSWAVPHDPLLGHLRDLIFVTELGVLVALLSANLAPFGIVLPTAISGLVARPEGKPYPTAVPAPVGATTSLSTPLLTPLVQIGETAPPP